MCFRPRTVLFGVWTISNVIWGKYAPKAPQKGGVNWQFQAKTPKSVLHRNISGTINPTWFRPRKSLRGWSAITPKQIQHGWLPPSWKSIWRHNSAAHGPIWTKFSTRMQNNTTFTAKWSRSKPEVYQYGGHLFFQNGSSYISAIDEIWFVCLLIDWTFWRQWHQQIWNRK